MKGDNQITVARDKVQGADAPNNRSKPHVSNNRDICAAFTVVEVTSGGNANVTFILNYNRCDQIKLSNRFKHTDYVWSCKEARFGKLQQFFF